MGLTRNLAETMLRAHPARAALVLEAQAPDAAVALLADGDEGTLAEVLRRISPQRSRQALEALPPARAAKLLERLELDESARLLRLLDDTVRSEVLAALEPRSARPVRALLGFREGTAGALMDPRVLALPQGVTAGEAFERVRADPSHARYNLYVIDDQQHLVGALNLRELFLADPARTLGELMVPTPHRLPADAPASEVVSHPGWKEIHALPVVDTEGRYLGAIRYRKLRELEQALLAGRSDDHDTSAALGQLFAAGAGGLFEALGGAESGQRGARRER
jgi:magnesium transporter